MKITNQNSLLKLADIVRSEHTFTYLIDLLIITAIAKYLSPNNTFRNIGDFNKIVSQSYPELTYIGNLSSKHISEFNELDISPKEICDFLFTLLSNNSNNSGYFDISTEYSRELSQMVKLPAEGNIASLNCSGISILEEVIRQNNFKGNVHLYSSNENALKFAFLRIYPLNQNIALHLGGPEIKNFTVSDLNYFDFIYSMPPMVRREGPIENYISLAQDMLNEKGILFLFAPSGLLSTKSKKNVRKLIIDRFDIDAIFNLSKAFKPFSGIDSAILLLRKKSHNMNDTFMAHLNFLDDSFEDIKYVVEKYYDFKLGNSVQSISPIINQVSKDEILEDFNVLRFNPKLQKIRKSLIEKYDLKKLSDLCEIIRSNSRYSSKDYQRYSSNNAFKYIRITDIKEGIIDSSSVKWVYRKSPSEVQTRLGDILFSRTGTVGKIGIVDENSANSLISNSLVILRPYKNIVDKDYLYLALQSEYSTIQILGNVTGTTIAHFAITNMRSLEIPYKSLLEQEQSVGTIKELKDESLKLKKRLEQVEFELRMKINSMFD